MSDNLYLSENIRNFTYEWVWRHINKLDRKTTTFFDIGCRDSLFPAFLAWRGFQVTVVERDRRFTEKQLIICKNWNTLIKVENCDFLSLPTIQKYYVISSLFSLQHCIDNDINAYYRVGDFLKEDGFFFLATEFNYNETKFQNGRDDGDLRIYSREDIMERIEKPLNERGIVECERYYLNVDKKKVRISSPREATIVLMMFKKSTF